MQHDLRGQMEKLSSFSGFKSECAVTPSADHIHGVCAAVCSCSRFLVNSLTAAGLAGTVMMVVSTGWLLGNNYLTVLCLHWNTQWAL